MGKVIEFPSGDREDTDDPYLPEERAGEADLREVERKNRENQERVARDRAKANESVKRSYRLKPKS